MKFKIRVREQGSDREWDEPYDKNEVTDQASAEQWAAGIIEFFNSTCTPGERGRQSGGLCALRHGESSHGETEPRS